MFRYLIELCSLSNRKDGNCFCKFLSLSHFHETKQLSEKSLNLAEVEAKACDVSFMWESRYYIIICFFKIA